MHHVLCGVQAADVSNARRRSSVVAREAIGSKITALEDEVSNKDEIIGDLSKQ